MSRNIAPKIVSILFALVLWIYVMNTFNPTEYRNFPGIPVRLMNVEELKEQKLAVKDNADFKARVKLIARRDELDKVLTEQIQIRADLRGYGEGINNIPLEVITPNNIKADVTPRFIRVELERIISEQREVKVITSGVPKDNFIIGNLEYRPTVVWIEGAESHVNLVKSVIAQLDVTGKSGNVVLNLPLKPVNNKNEEVTDVDIKTSHVDVSLSVDALKSVPIKPDLQITTEAGYAVTNIKINPTNITLRGQKELIDRVTEVITEPLKIDNLNQDRTLLNVKLDLPEGITLHKNVSVTIDLSLEKIEEATYKISKDGITFDNVHENLKVDMGDVSENINVRIIAPRDVLDSIKEDDIKIAVDLNGLDAGKYTVELAAQLPFVFEKDIKELYLNPKTVDIRLVDR
ncbi:MAG: YbbR-like domain-containing protein [Natronincolaceae bacterium]|jgi:YbbR domain-containing protein|nr:CdaR family protein [Bacillota bacterium]NLK91322.1 hypothetical protein [Clostridiales bacterium]